MISRRSLLLAASASIAIAPPAMAQVAAPNGPQGPSEEPQVRVDDVIVTGTPFGIGQRATTIATSVLDEEALAVAPAASLGDLLSGLPGLRSTSFAPGASRPVIRGLTGPRVQVLTNGVGLIDASSVSPDHQVATDPAESNRIEVVRGPATLAYGGSAIGGVINILDGRVPEEQPDGGLDGALSAQTSTVDQGASFAAHADVGLGRFVLHVDGLKKDADDYDIPSPPISQRLSDATGVPRDGTGTQSNSFSELEAWDIGGSFVADSGFAGVSYKETDSTYGVVAEEDVFIQLEQQRFDARGEYRFGAGPFRAIRGSYGQADYTHTEFEAVGVPGTTFASDGHEARLDLIQRDRGGWNGAVGAQTLSREFSAVGDEAYIPASKIEEAGVYTVQRLDRTGYGFEGGLRYDRRTLTATPLGTTTGVERAFDNWSASAAAFIRPSRDLFLGLSLARNERAPSEVELFADGLHIATGAYETGDPTLESEKVTTLEGTVHLDRGALRGDLHVYASKYDGFIDARDTGSVFVDGGESFPIFQYVQTGADFRGFEAQLAYDVWTSGDRVVTLEGAADHVDADTDLGPAARIPPWSLTGRVHYASRPVDLSLEVRRVGEQDDVAAFELPTDGYTMVNLFGAWRPFADRNVTLFAEGRNLGDVEAREHASFLKDIAPQPGRNLRVGVNYRF
ncbi:iron complex outermembrane receptor protein [Brevundimonas alba]|uniref:Iron complex outermembrane receptor protein n=1 Tax=Brevundimonas alba TaxID=74314 RepID=A0A7X5YJ45_9CAUL|nr:TonB-dependent receptor [Brevundimonas alba]NJC40920.1 iron complex outermembrane receptor protein [Brevundimonas alba]